MADRFDKFTERGRRVLQLSQEEAKWLNHNYIGTEHLLLGLIREEGGVAGKILANLGLDLDRVRAAVELAIERGSRPASRDIGLTPRARKAIELSVDEARRLHHHYVGTEHLLLGLVREGGGIAACVLESLDVPLDKVRDHVMYVVRSPVRYPPPPSLGETRPAGRLDLDLTSAASTLEILRWLREQYEAHHRLKIADEALKAAVELSALDVADRSLLERAADVVDEAAMRVRSRDGDTPAGFLQLLRDREMAEQAKHAAISEQQYERAAEHDGRLAELRARLAEIERSWATRGFAGWPVVTAGDVVEVIAARTGVAADEIAARYRQQGTPDDGG